MIGLLEFALSLCVPTFAGDVGIGPGSIFVYAYIGRLEGTGYGYRGYP